MTLKNLFSSLMAIALVAMVGCEKNPDEGKGGTASFKLDSSELMVGANGGAQEVTYTIENHANGAVVLTNCTENWITNLSTATFGSITFNVAPNYKQEAREAKITVSYTAVDAKYEILVKQEASTLPSFEFEVTINEPTRISLNVTPADLSSAYVCRIYTEEHIKTFGLEEDYALIAYDLKAISDEADYVDQTTLNYLQNISHKGKAFDIIFDKLIPDTNYVVYTYHIDLVSGQSSTGEVYREVIRTASPTMADDALEMTLEVKGATVKQTITTKEEDTYFYTEHWSVDDFKSYFGANADPEQIFVSRWNEQTSTWLNVGYYPSQIIEQWCKQGSQTIVSDDLKANTEYYFYAFAINADTAFVGSKIVLQKISTLSTEESGMTINIEVKDIYATTANVYWTASDPNGRFARSVFPKAEYDSWGATDEQRFAYINANYSFYTATGYTDMNLANLTPNTTYVAFAYGLEGESPNTRIFTKEFTTKDNVAGSSNIQITLGAHFNLDEVAEADSEHWGEHAGKDGYALVPVTISGVQPTDEIFWILTTMPLDYYNYDDEWIRDITSNDFYRQAVYSNTYLQIPYEQEYNLIAVAKDANGNFGKLFKKEIYLYKSDAADISTYKYVEPK
ncbi:MAG: BACON domain-containing protein [Alistipes sp.]|nr:BACON domain-containing protein [Alistipes sp.]